MSIAIYRRYRPQTFQEVIGQDHVVSPLQSALAAGRTTHAYLFSGPRGCGKTTSARILARCLNCAQYPTDTPCGECESCIELARDGSGSLDVVEMDAASHGGVDDARELREQAGFAPVRDRFKIFIIDEAHMVSNQGFNANPEMTSFVFRETLMTHLLLWGNAFAQVIRNGRDEVIGLYPLMPNRMSVGRDLDTKQLYYEYQTSWDEPAGEYRIVRLTSADVLHIPGLGYWVFGPEGESRNLLKTLTTELDLATRGRSVFVVVIFS